jgi:hypothetical protein
MPPSPPPSPLSFNIPPGATRPLDSKGIICHHQALRACVERGLQLQWKPWTLEWKKRPCVLLRRTGTESTFSKRTERNKQQSQKKMKRKYAERFKAEVIVLSLNVDLLLLLPTLLPLPQYNLHPPPQHLQTRTKNQTRPLPFFQPLLTFNHG